MKWNGFVQIKSWIFVASVKGNKNDRQGGKHIYTYKNTWGIWDLHNDMNPSSLGFVHVEPHPLSSLPSFTRISAEAPSPLAVLHFPAGEEKVTLK